MTILVMVTTAGPNGSSNGNEAVAAIGVGALVVAILAIGLWGAWSRRR